MRTQNIRKSFLASIIVLFISIVSTGIVYAEMPAYERLSPITAEVYSPMAIAVDSTGNIYVTESVNNKLLVYSQDHTYKYSLLHLDKPKSVAVDSSGRIFIGNHHNTVLDKGNVEVYDADLNFISKLGTGNEEFSIPTGIAIDDSSENVFVADMGSNVVKVYDTSWDHAFSFDGTLNGGGQFLDPSSIVIDSGEIIVLDHPMTLTQDYQGNDFWVKGARIQFFDMSGAYKSGFSKYGGNVGDMRYPSQITTDNEGRIYVSDTWDHIIKVYDRDGSYQGAVYDNVNQMRVPMGITINDENTLYISSLITHKVEVYSIAQSTTVAPEPISSTLFIVGGAVLGFRRMRKG